MRQIDRLILKELIGPWLFGVAMFSTLLMAATYLNKIAGYIVQGLPASLIFKITMLLVPAILAKTFAMSMLLAALLAFGRLSSDSELVALRAGGASLVRIVRPVMAMSLVIAVATFYFNDRVVPDAAAKSAGLITEIASHQDGKAGQPVSFSFENGMNGFLRAQAYDIANKTLNQVSIVAFDDNWIPTWYAYCKQLEYHPAPAGAPKDQIMWKLRGGGYLLPSDGGVKVTMFEASPWPKQVPNPNLTPRDISAIGTHDLDTMSMSQIQYEIRRGLRDGSLKPEDIHNFEYGYWNKISVGLAAFVFGTLGAVLGIRNQRTGTAAGFALAIGIIFGYFTLTNFMNVWAIDGIIPAWIASFAPLFIGAVAAGVIMWRRNN